MTPRRSTRHLDEDDVRVRPPRSTRPRSKERPRHEDAAEGHVLTVDRGRYACLVDGREVVAMKARELGRRGRIVVGDRVDIVGDLSGRPDTLARIVRVRERTSVLRRTADDTDPVERVIVANADQLVMVVALADPEPRPRLVDRYLVAAYDAGLDPLLVLTKSDLAAPEPLLTLYEPLHVPAVVTHKGGRLDQIRDRLTNRTSVLVGHSGVGKSTLVNALVPEARRATGAVNVVTGRGRHTTSSALALPLPDGGWVIDTPGVRSFGLAHVDPDRIVRSFPDLAQGATRCPPKCAHQGAGCALDTWVAEHASDPRRLDSLRRLLAARDQDDADDRS